MKFLRAILVLAIILLVLGGLLFWRYYKVHNYTGRVDELRGSKETGIVYSLDGKYPNEGLLLFIDVADMSNFDGTLPRVGDHIHISGKVMRSDGVVPKYLFMRIKDPSQINEE